jgi:stearoyl-CoA desaturase (delta-9 desaturase)
MIPSTLTLHPGKKVPIEFIHKSVLLMKKAKHTAKRPSVLLSLLRWFDSDASSDQISDADIKKVDWFRIIPFVILHLMCLGVIWVGWSWFAVLTAAIYLCCHRQLLGTARTVVVGSASSPSPPLCGHRKRYPFTQPARIYLEPHRVVNVDFPTKMQFVKDWAKYPELRWINRFDTVIPVLLAVILFLGGNLLQKYTPGLGTNGPQLLIWGFFISSVLLFHGTVTINSFDHMIGSRRYDTPDTSRNNAILALITLGEGWHNNHHHYAISARQGFYWWEIDITY